MTEDMLRASRAAYASAPPVGDDAYFRYPDELTDALRQAWPQIMRANAEDVASAEERGLPSVLVERIRLRDDHLAQLTALSSAVARSLPDVLAPEPETRVGNTAAVRRKIPKPLGLALMVYEARPTVTVEGALLPVVTGNAVILRGGKEIVRTNQALSAVVAKALVESGLPAGMVSVLDDPSRKVLRELLGRGDAIDVLIPRGSPSLIDYCRTSSTIPVVASGGGVNHLYVHRSADLELAAAVTLDSKLAEPTACNTLELVLVDRAVAQEFVASLTAADAEVTIKLDGRIDEPTADEPHRWRIERLAEHDFGREFLAPAVGVLMVDGLDEAVEHISRFGSMHTEGVVASDVQVSGEFVKRVDAAALVVNGSLRLHDGPTLGLGAEVSISTGRLHVRGPVTLRSLLTYTWLVEANGTLRSTVR
ncbi:glutamate-5-semialdehyde dehydrogenase [Saccharopolyspora tripterygii]